ALIREFYHTSETVEEWRGSLAKLSDATAPLEQLLESTGRDSEGDAFIGRNSPALAYFQEQVQNAIASLCGDETDPVAAIYDALAHVTRARLGLILWQGRLIREGLPPQGHDAALPVVYPDARQTARELERGMAALRATLSDDDDLARC